MKEILIYTGGPIRTMSEESPQAEAFAVCGGRFAAVGSLADVRDWAGGRSRIVDLGRRTVLPGFIETHNHLSDQAMNLLQVDCTPDSNTDISRILVRLKEKADQTPAGQWILGQGYDDSHIADQRHLDLKELDAAVPHHPVYVSHITDHMAYVNSKALAAAGLVDSLPLELGGGEIGRDASGNPNGLLIEPAAMNLVADHIPPYTKDDMLVPLADTIDHFNRRGITSVHDAGLGWKGNPSHIIRAYQELFRGGRLNVRVYLSVMAPFYRALKDLGFVTEFGYDRLKLGSVKLFQDGSIQIHTAALRRPYHDRPEYAGETIYPQDELDRLAEEFHAAGCQLAIHCNGDAAISSALESLEKAQKKHYRPDPRHLMIHCQMADDEHIGRMKTVGAIPSYFINHVYYWGDSHGERFLGPERAAKISPLAATVRHGLPFTLHSDLPVTPVAPLFAVHCAVNRRTRSGKVLGPDQRIGVGDALKAYTTWGAMASFEETDKGSIEPGKLADFVVLSADPFVEPPEKIKNIEVLATFVGGDRVWGGL